MEERVGRAKGVEEGLDMEWPASQYHAAVTEPRGSSPAVMASCTVRSKFWDKPSIFVSTHCAENGRNYGEREGAV